MIMIIFIRTQKEMPVKADRPRVHAKNLQTKKKKKKKKRGKEKERRRRRTGRSL